LDHPHPTNLPNHLSDGVEEVDDDGEPTPILDLIKVQDLLGGQLITVLEQSGYRPPPPAVDLVTDASTAVARALAEDHQSMLRHSSQDPLRVALRKILILAETLEGLRGSSLKKIRRAVNPLQRRITMVAAGLALLIPPVVLKPAIEEAVKTYVQYQLSQWADDDKQESKAVQQVFNVGNDLIINSADPAAAALNVGRRTLVGDVGLAEADDFV
jgi:hypothetical protein